MSDDETPLVGHFTTYRATERFWGLESAERREAGRGWLEALRESADHTVLYLTQGIEAASDLLVWSTARSETVDAPGRFFRARAAAEAPHRRHFRPVHILWGMTRPSEYSRSAKSAQEIDSFAPERAPYLIAYPFAKTAEWYLMGREARQGMMNEHIRVGKQYREIKQLLLYSVGLQDQEFVVVYETHDLALFSRLVQELRMTEARRYTLTDTPLHTGALVDDEGWLDTLG